MIRNLSFNSNTLQSIEFNENQIYSVQYNSETVFDQEEEIPSEETVFELYPEFIPTNNHVFQPNIVYNSNSYSFPTNVQLTGNNNFFIKAKQSNTGEINIQYEKYQKESNQYRDFVYKFENYGYGFIRRYKENEWSGGTENAYEYFGVKFIPENNTSLAKTFYMPASVDEDETFFIKGLYRSKVIRIPYSGMSSYLTFQAFPMTFDSIYYENDLKYYITDFSKLGQLNQDGQIIKSGSYIECSINEIPDNTIISNASIDKIDSLQSKFNFEVSQNPENSYRISSIAFTENKVYNSSGGTLYGIDSVQIHFIQEPYSENRIYYGIVPYSPNTWEPYLNEQTQEFHYIFQFASSEIVTSSFTISTSTKTPNSYNVRRNIVAVPKGKYSIISNTGTIPLLQTDNYSWGNQLYEIYQLDTSQNTIYTITLL